MYTCKYYLPAIYGVIPVAVALVGAYFLANISNPFTEDKRKPLLWGSAFLIVGIIVSLVFISSYISNYKNVYLPYKKGNYMEVEGEVEELKTVPFMGNGEDEFCVNGIRFSIGNPFLPGYQKQAAHHGLITNEGMYVKIRYIPGQETDYIMELEIVSLN